MGTLIGFIIFGVICFLLFKLPDIRFNNYMPPNGYRIDYDKQMRDLVVNHLSKEEVKRSTVNGKYNVKN